MNPRHSELISHIKASGYRWTPQREIVLSVIAASDGHLSAEEILKRVRRAYPLLNKSVIYRNLELLTAIGLVSRTDLGQGRVEYELHRHPHHHHLVCRNCRSMTEVRADILGRLETALRTEYGFASDLDHLAIFGLCRRCRSQRVNKGHHPHGL